MSHIDASLLARYNSLTDPHLASYFQNPMMRRQLRKNGLITRNGEIISENSYRQIMARKEHQQHVRELLAQAIVHKTLDMERMRQVHIKKKLEEISKIELVRRVKDESDRRGDEDVLPYLSPRRPVSRPSSVPPRRSGRPRPVSAPSRGKRPGHREMMALATHENGVPVTLHENPHDEGQAGKGKRKKRPTEIDDRNLYSLDSQALQDYTMTMNQGRTGPSPYRNNHIGPELVPIPPSTRHMTRHRIQHTDRLGRPIRAKKGSVAGLHRQEATKRHPQRVQTLCHITLHYFGPHLKLDYERLDPRDEVIVEQQHCGGNSLTVFRDKVLPKSDFTFVSRRHRGYPFSLTIYIDGTVDCRLSTCCEYKHGMGSRLGGPQGHFGIVYIHGAEACYRCQVNDRLKSQEEKKQQKAAEKKEKQKEAKKREEAEAEKEHENADYSSDEDQKSETNTDPGSVTDSVTDNSVQENSNENPNSELDSSKRYSDDESTPRKKISSRDPNSDRPDSRSRPRSRFSSGSRSSSSSRSWSTSTSSSSSRTPSGERTPKNKVPASPEFPKQRKKDNRSPKNKDKSPTPSSQHTLSKTSNRSSSSDSDIDSDRKTPPASVSNSSNNNNFLLDSVAQSDDNSAEEPVADTQALDEEKEKERLRRAQEAELVEEERQAEEDERPEEELQEEKEEKAREQQKEKESKDNGKEPLVNQEEAPHKPQDKRSSTDDSDLDTLRTTAQGGDDTLTALADEMAKVLEKEEDESPVEKSTSDTSSDSNRSSCSDSDTEQRTTKQKTPEPSFQFTTDPDTSDFAGGADPDHVASDLSKPATHLTQIGVTPGPRHDGSIRPLVIGKRNIELTSLSLSEDQVTELGEVLKDSPNVESLVLRNSGITDTGMRQLNKGLANAKNIKIVNLNCNKLTDADQISELLQQPKAIEILLLHGNPFGDVGIKKLTSSLINIHRSAVSDEDMAEVRRKAKDLVADAMYQALHSASLESIVTQGSVSTNNSGSIAKLLAESERLTTSNLSGLALRQLDLGDCEMTSDGVSGIAEVIAHNLPIENLSLTGNKGVDIIGWDAVAEALKVNSKITTLSLDYNNLGDGGASVIAEALEENKAIRNIDLEGNKIGEQGAQKLLEAIRKSKNLEDITLMPGNNIPESLLAQIKNELAKRGPQHS